VNSSAVKRVVFREVLPGDVLKFAAKSNKTKSGGGARDFRYNPYDKFDDVFGRLLKGRRQEDRVRNKITTSVTVYENKAGLCTPSGVVPGKTLEFEPPTSAREGEGRLTRLNSLGLSVPKNQGRVFLMVWQTDDGKVWFGFATENELQSGKWHASINDFLLSCMTAKRRHGNAAQGFIDFEQGSQFCNGVEK
jgi:hypothetical protein